MFCSIFVALQPEQELDLAQLVEADTQEAANYGKKHSLEFLWKIREQLTEVGLQAAALPEDQAQKYILAVSSCEFTFTDPLQDFLQLNSLIPFLFLSKCHFHFFSRLFVLWRLEQH